MGASVIADSSAWIEYLRATGSATHRRVVEALREGELVVTDPVLLEVLAGARTPADWRDLRRLLGTFRFVSVESPGDWIDAAALRRHIRFAGRRIASIDCLVAVIAMRVGMPVLHADKDFDVIAQHSDLQLA
jgi:predicted nucleic acid-binding protein